MSFHRTTVTKASQVMIPTYPVFFTWVGLSYLLGDPARTSTPSFDVVREMAPIDQWAWVFLFVAVFEWAALALHRDWLMLTGLAMGMAVAASWAVGFVGSLITTENASLNGPALWLFVAVAHLASMRSLKYDTWRIAS